MSQFWMVRAGEGSKLIQDFERESVVAIGWPKVGDLTDLTTMERVRARVRAVYPRKSPQTIGIYAGQLHKFRSELKVGDRVVTSDRHSREYLLGTITREYEFDPAVVFDHPNVRRVKWESRVSWDVLAPASRNSLGAILTLFEPDERALADIEDAISSGRTQPPAPASDASAASFEDLLHEFEREYLKTDRGLRHVQNYLTAVRTGQSNFAKVRQELRTGNDVTDQVLTTLLPHNDTRPHRDGGFWVHTAPAITGDVKSWYESQGRVQPQEWPKVAEVIFHFIERATDNPAELEDACAEFSASSESKGFQGGMLSPILNALRADQFSIVNSKVAKTIAALGGVEIAVTMTDYPTANATLRAFVAEHEEELRAISPDGVDVNALFDLFAHWYVAERREDRSTQRIEDETRASDLDKKSSASARRIVEFLCPDPALRAAALEGLARAIRSAHELSQSAWSITLRPREVRLNVAGIVAMDLRRTGVGVSVHKPTLDVDTLDLLTPFEAGEEFTYIPQAELFLIPFDRLGTILPRALGGHWELMRRAVKKSDAAPFRAAHSPGVLAYLRELGLEVPEPTHADAAAEPRPVPYVAHPSYSLEDLARETHTSEDVAASWVAGIIRKGQGILYGPPGTGKTFTAERIARHLVAGGDGIIDLVQFHPAYAYEDFIQGLRPVVRNERVEFEVLPGRFKEFCRVAAQHQGVSVLIIDEINRANIPQVFGELMFLLEYRDREIPLSTGGRLRIPANVRIIGTMNTADRSIALVDHALRRRFAFIRLFPDFGTLARFHETRDVDVSGLVAVLDELNKRINDPNYAIGISFFMRDALKDHLPAIWRTEIEPYLEELFFDRTDVVDEFRYERLEARELVV